MNACAELFGTDQVAKYLGYEISSGLSIGQARTQLITPSSPEDRYTLGCEFADNEGHGTSYNITVFPAGTGGGEHGTPTVTAQGVTVTGTSAGLVPRGPQHLVPLFTAAATRAQLTSGQAIATP